MDHLRKIEEIEDNDEDNQVQGSHHRGMRRRRDQVERKDPKADEHGTEP